MILNDRALRAAKTRVSLLKQEIATSAFSDFKSQLSADTLELRRKALSEELDRIAAQIQAYERLKGSRLANDEELDTTQLGLLPILGRISKGLSQRELGELLNLKEQQIQRYEADRYSSISLSRFERILQVLGVSLTADWQNVALIEQESKDIEDVFSNTSPESLREIEKRNWFENSGLSKENKLTNLVAYALRAKKLAGGVTLHRKTVLKDRRINTAALCAWQARIVNLAQSASVKVGKRFNLADVSWVRA
jgi:HTH-type transcriptional regulator / antitoxin HigA